MSSAKLIVHRFTELCESGQLDSAFGYLSEAVIYNSWMGTVEGRNNVITFMKDNVRFMHHPRNFNRWRLVQHSLDPAVQRGRESEDGRDAQGFATFERDGTIASKAKYYFSSVPVRETVVVRDHSIHLINVTKRL